VIAPLARLGGIERRFGTVLALSGADLEIRGGEVHGLLGANGAGKSTLLNVLGGMIEPDAGVVEVDGVPVRLRSPRDAWAHGIALVHQHFTLVPRLSALENLALGSGRRRGLAQALEDLMARTGFRIPLDAPVEHLGVGDRQRIEILKALLRDPRVLVLDEPTAVLTPNEVDGLFELLEGLAADGRGVVLVAHKLDEVLRVAGTITVLRNGRTVLTGPSSEQSVPELVRAMVGGDALDTMALDLSDIRPAGLEEVPGRPVESGEARPSIPARQADDVVVRLRGVALREAGGPGVQGVDLEVGRGEIVGVAGVEGNGQRVLARLASGRAIPDAGVAELPPGIGFVPQDRSTEGLIAEFDLVENVGLALQREPEYVRGPWMRWDAVRDVAERIRARFAVAAPSVTARAGSLSGGNQQRVIVGRELTHARDVLVAENPTRGLDVAGAAFVHDELRRLASQGVGVLLVSTDLDEVLGLAHRVYALARGRLHAVPPEQRTREGVGALMLVGDGDG
jgi:ABC-type uncharacterized transport system ATPase subunit